MPKVRTALMSETLEQDYAAVDGRVVPSGERHGPPNSRRTLVR